MPLILSDENTRTLSNEELLIVALKEYAAPHNYESYEKDYGTGRLVERSPWITRDKGQHARQALDIILKRGQEGQANG